MHYDIYLLGMADSTKRTLIKALVFRVISAISSFILIYALTGNAGFGVKFTIIDSIIKISLYFIHERAWIKIKWGKVRKWEKQLRST